MLSRVLSKKGLPFQTLTKVVLKYEQLEIYGDITKILNLNKSCIEIVLMRHIHLDQYLP